MKYLIILILFITSCTDKKVTTEPVVVEPIIAEVPKPEPIKLSYDKGLDLMLVDTSFHQWNELMLQYEEDGIWGEKLTFYYAMYWDTNTQTYYGVTNNNSVYGFIPITNMQFEYTIDEQKQHETVFYPTLKEVFTNTGASLLYLGSISPLERVYLDPTNQVYYIKYLAHFDTTLYIIDKYDNIEPTITNTNTLPIFPFYKPSISVYYSQEIDADIISTNDDKPSIDYTNSDGDKFSTRGPTAPLVKDN